MALVSKNIPNLINGVSQQPPSLRLETQGEVQENGFSDVVDGLKKRPPTLFIKRLIKATATYTAGALTPYNTQPVSEAELSTAFVHTYKRSEDEQYTVVILSSTTATILVYDEAGNLRYQSNKASWSADGQMIETNTDSTAYVSQLSKENMAATSVADATFVVSKTAVVSMSNEINPLESGASALVYLKSVNYGRDYQVKLTTKSTTSSYSVTTATQTGNAVTNQSSGSTNSDELKVSTVINNLRNNLLTNASSTGSDQSFDGSQTFPTSNPVQSQALTSITELELNSSVQTTDNARLVVTAGNNTVPYDNDGNSGWMYKPGDSTTIIIPTGVLETEFDRMDHVNYYTRPQVIVRKLEAGATLDITLAPVSYTEEPYFVINSSESGQLGDFQIIGTDDDGGTNLRVFKDNAKSFTDLPNQCIDGYRLGVIGDNNKKEDNFHVVFEGGAGSGYWKETVKGGLKNYYNLNSMPHTLKQKANLAFEFTTGEWNQRVCGDENTNPTPSFVGNTISDIFFHRNRLGVLSDENIIFSEASGYYNFWRTTVRTLLDSDPIDVAVSQNEVSELKHALPIQENLLLFSELNQFTLSAEQLMTPAEITIEQSTKFECDLTASPVGAGNSVFFATKSGDFSGVREYYTQGDTEIKDATSITTNVPKYIKGGIRKMAASSNENTLVCLTDDNMKECYVYKWFDQGQERLQASWSKWIFKEEIVDVSFNNATLYFVFKDGTMQKMLLRESPVNISYTVGNLTASTERIDSLLDCRFFLQRPAGVVSYASSAISSIYTEVSANSVFTDHRGAIIATGSSSAAFDTVATYLNGTHVENGVTINNYVYAGEPYTFKYQLSEQVFRPVQGDTTQLARFQLRSMSFNYNDTGTFKVTVDSLGRDPKVTTFTGRILSQANNLLGFTPVVESGSLKVGIQSQAKHAKVTITNDTHLPSIFSSVEWEGFVNLRNQRL